MLPDYGAMLKQEMAEAKAREERIERLGAQRAGPGWIDRRSGSVRIREVRADLRLSQAEMAETLQVGFRTFQGWEAGRPVPKPVLLLAELIRDSPDARWRVLPKRFWI